jgi:hypothetical protein
MINYKINVNIITPVQEDNSASIGLLINNSLWKFTIVNTPHVSPNVSNVFVSASNSLIIPFTINDTLQLYVSNNQYFNIQNYTNNLGLISNIESIYLQIFKIS